MENTILTIDLDRLGLETLSNLVTIFTRESNRASDANEWDELNEAAHLILDVWYKRAQAIGIEVRDGI